MQEIRDLNNLSLLSEEILKYIKELNKYKTSIESAIQECDLERIDLDHILETQSLNAPELSKLALTRKEILLRRRRLKDELDLINRIPEIQWKSLYSTTTNIRDIYKRCDENKRNRRYIFRGNLHKKGFKMSEKIKGMLELGFI